MRTAFAILLLTGATAFAVKTEKWEIKSPADFMRGKLQRLSVSNEGELRLGYASSKLGEFAKEIWCAAVAKDGTIYFGTGSPADVYAVDKDGKVTKLFETDAIAVTSLAVDSRGNVFAATMAEGKIFKIVPAKEKTSAEFCRLRAPYVWALVVDKQDHLFAATGPDGKIYRVGADGKPEEWYAAEESNLISLALDGDGSLLAGSGDRGLLYRVTDRNKGVVLHQFAEDEVKSLVVNGGDLYIGVNKQKVKRPRGPGPRRPSAAEFEDLTQRLSGQFGTRAAASAGDQDRTTLPEARIANLLTGALYQRNADGRVDKLASWENESILGIAVDRDGGVLTAMGGSARVYRVQGNQHWDLLFDFDEQQALALALRDGRLAFVGSGNVGNGYLIDAQKTSEGEFTSEVRDCRFLTTWGNLSWDGTGVITVSTRTGNTSLPDATWSEWSEPLKTSPSRVTSPAARFIQLRTRLARASDPALQTLSVYFRTQNQKPEIASVEIGERRKPAAEKSKPKATGDDKTDSGDATDPDTSAATPPSSPAATDTKRDELHPKPASTIKQINWHASDKDGDALAYRLFYQAQGDDVWVPVAETRDKPLKRTEYAWDTESIPDGWYRVKVVASDEESNPAGESLSDEQTSEPFKVDNRKPEVAQLSFDTVHATLSGVARDNLSLIQFLEYSVDGGDWKFFAPKDGLFDAREKAFEVKLDVPSTGVHSIAVRATDDDGNVSVEKLTLKASP